MKKIIVLCIAAVAIAVPVFAAEKMTIAIMDFQAQDVPRADALKISELIRNEMVNSGRYLVLERAQVGKILKEQGFQMTGCTDITCAVQVGKLLSARKILVGTVMKFGENVAVTGRVVDVEKGVAEFAEKDRALSKEDLFYMVERFCDKLTLRITGKSLYKKEEPSVINESYRTSQKYKPVKDPFAWLALSAGIASGVGFIVAYDSYIKKRNGSNTDDYSKFAKYSAWRIGDIGCNLLFLKLADKNGDAYDRIRKTRDTNYYICGGVGGLALAMLITFVGRYAYYEDQIATNISTNNVAVFVPSQYVNPVDWINGKPGFGLGMSMRF